MHGVNLDQLGRRDPAHYGGVTLEELERAISETARELGLEVRFFQTNHEGEFVEHLHRLEGLADAIVLNPGAWTHYSYAIRDALELARLPAVEVHLSDVDAPRRVAAPLGDHRPVREPHLRQGARRLPRRARAPARGDRRVSARADRLIEKLADAGVDLVLVTDLINVRYLTGYTGSNGLALIGPDTRVFITDFRYVEQAAEQVDSSFDRRRAPQDLLEAIGQALPGGDLRLGFEEAHLSVREHARLGELVPERVELVGVQGVVEGLRAVKEPGEVAAIRAATALADEAFEHLVAGGLVGRTERELAVELEFDMRRRGAERPSFEPIVAAGPHGALPHASPRDVVVRSGDMVVIDWGAQLEGYCSDCTRTVAAGAGTEHGAEIYRLVLDAQLGALDAVAPGAGGREVDAVARQIIEAAGHGEHFGHGLGHGVGLDIHEAPRLAQRSESVLEAGNVVTVEPGVYLPGDLGVRIEDLVVVTDSGREILTSLSKELTVTS